MNKKNYNIINVILIILECVVAIVGIVVQKELSQWNYLYDFKLTSYIGTAFIIIVSILDILRQKIKESKKNKKRK